MTIGMGIQFLPVTIAAADHSSGARVLPVLLAIFIYTVVGRALYTGGILVHGMRGRVERDDRPLVYWFHVIFLAGFATLLLSGAPVLVFFIWVAVSIVGFIVVMKAERRTTEQTIEDPYQNLPRWVRLIAMPLGLLMIVGMIGCITSFLADFGALNSLPNSFEWPVGHADRVITMPNGYHVVPLEVPRVQVYDPDWRFVRGWFIEGSKGSFLLHPCHQDQFEVFTGALKRGGSDGYRYVFTLNGEQVSRGDCSLDPAAWSAIEKQGTSAVVPTSIWLWPFSSGGHAILMLLSGAVILGVFQLVGWLTTPSRAIRQQTWIRIETDREDQ